MFLCVLVVCSTNRIFFPRVVYFFATKHFDSSRETRKRDCDDDDEDDEDEDEDDDDD